MKKVVISPDRPTHTQNPPAIHATIQRNSSAFGYTIIDQSCKAPNEKRTIDQNSLVWNSSILWFMPPITSEKHRANIESADAISITRVSCGNRLRIIF